jgi:hypothetical protein
MNITKKTFLISGIALYLIAAGASFAVFSKTLVKKTVNTTNESKVNTNSSDVAIDPNEAKDQICPLNGAMYTKTEQAIWAKRRPLVVMIENSPDARPHSGLNRSDVIYETVAEGGVTRFMAVYLCDAARGNVVVAPVRSVRTYFIDWASEYGGTPLFAHVGGANCSGEKLSNGSTGPCKTEARAQAIEQLVKFEWRYSTGNDLDQFSVGAKAYIRNENRTGQPVATEHSVEGRTEKLWAVGLERGWTNLDPDGVDWTKSFKPWKFKDEAAAAERGAVTPIAHDFWSGYKQFDARWDYDATTNTYKRSTGGEIHTDLETKEQLYTKNVVILFTKETGPVDPLKHMLYTTIGEGKALVFQDGKVIEANWSKKSRLDRTIFTDKKGKEIQFNRGRIWISIVDNSTTVSYPQQ